ncbi:MAG: FecR domain-containing protein [Chitinophagaceae bacterium]|nr:FecR domain-containing protein [Chitinophagaceae bacterium]
MSRFQELLNGYLRDSLSENELREFFQLAEENGLLPDESMIREQGFDERHEGLTDEAQREKMLLAIRMRAGAQERSTPTWRWVVAAAAVVMAVMAGAYLLGSKERKPAVVKAKVYKNDVAPGVNGAVLRLSDGSEIVLDSVGNGEVSRQGNTKVIKQTGGQLVYQDAGKGDVVLYNTLSTAKGKQFRVVLPDGTKVWLNAYSSIHYPTSFTGEHRLVEITGEVYFEVAANAAMPFIVKTHREEVTVLGTQFNINSYEDEPAEKATLLEGAIQISRASGQVVLRPGQQASMGPSAAGIAVAEVNTEDVVAWKNGYFHFDNADIQTVMRQLTRWYDVEVKFNGVPPTTGDFKGEIGRSLTLAQVLKILEQTRVHFRIEEDKRIVIFP